MFVLKKNLRLLKKVCFLAVFLFIFISCGSYLNKEEEGNPLARVGKSYLYIDAVAPFLGEGISSTDSAAIITNYINNWASKQLLLSKAKINLSEEKLTEYDTLVSNYRTDLYTRAYKEALVQQGSDSVVSEAQLQDFYEREKDNFKLKERIVRLRFVEIPKQFLNKKAIIESLKSFDGEDIKFLDSISVQFRKLNFNDSIWVSSSRVIQEIAPLTIENQDRYLKKSQFFELEDSLGVYLGKIAEVKEVNTIAPLSFVKSSITQVLLSRRKLDYVRKLETEIIDEAIKEKEFEVYVQDE
ncbi:peptidyl-prolyl cis-trans isomerase [Maribacter sp.]|uniref:peptidyl-prolyl cis-trans isomerase n=1 Tax=Maribacter sp. TaxID=1897614 RepID=UPI0025BCFCA5|nr:peptidyl-prolyl cis-trans isomerase [Maribacter sp.]